MSWYQVHALGRKHGVGRARLLASVGCLAAVLYVLYLVQSRQVETYEVTSESMEPALHVGDRWLMVPAETLKVGQVIVFNSPEDPNVRLVKRLVAVGPATVELRHGYLYVNGVPNTPPQGPEVLADQRNETWNLEAGEVFCVGDNREVSHDSRDFGPVARRTIRGMLSRRLDRQGWLGMVIR